ncbi:MAG: YebC/PmpR family DNA-binding transcriptional regulator, partial [Saprospiraceae bacterium]
MGRIFEVRKSTMFARYDRMAKQFTRIGKEIAISVKAGGPEPGTNSSLRRAIQNARSVNMPKDKIEAAIKRAMGKDMENYEEVMYEGYGPHGIAIIVEAATDNIVRTVANVRSIFNKGNGAMSTSGSVSFQFNKMGVFNLSPEGLNADDLELELIDAGLQEMGEGVDENG